MQAKEDPETREDMDALGSVEQRHITVEEAQVRTADSAHMHVHMR